MKKRILIAALLLATAAAALFAQGTGGTAFRSFEETANMYLGSPASVGTGWDGYLNPALLGTVSAPELLLTLTNPPDQWTTISEVGVFSSASGLGLGALSFRDAGGQIRTNMRISLGLGNKSFAFGLSNETAWMPESGQTLAFHAITAGGLIRPSPFASLGLVGTSTYSGDAMEATVDLGIRPFGTPLFTLFGDYTWSKAEDLLSSAWGAGAALEPIAGILLVGRIASDFTLTLGAQVSLGVTDLASHVRFTSEAKPQGATYSVRVGGQLAPSVLYKIMNQGVNYLELNLRGAIAARQNPFESSHSLLALLTMIKDARDDPSIAGIAMNTSGLLADSEGLWELREQLKDFKSAGKHVVVFIDRASLPLYHLASIADKIVMDPEGMVLLLGAVTGRGYFKGSLEKLGIGFEELRLFEYKSAAESFSRDSLSDADRRQYGAYIADVYNLIKAEILEDRKLTESTFESIINDILLLHPKEARERGLVDSIGRWEEVKTVITQLEGREERFLRYGTAYQPSGMELVGTLLSPSPLATPTTGLWSEPPRIAVVYALGSTDLDGGMMARKLAKVIEYAANDWFVKAIVLRVDSPGGDAVAADYVAEAVKAAKKKKPVIVSQGAVAGSGGYWVSMYGDSIVSSPFSLTGSIGVIGSWFYDNGLNQKLGITTDMIQIGRHADLGFGFLLPHRNLTQEERERFESLIMNMYGDFVSKVAQGRGKTVEEIEKIAQGRVWSGLQARDVGLVDTIGGLDAALALARQKAGITTGQEVRIMELPSTDPFAYLSPFVARIAGTNRTPALLDPWALGFSGMAGGKLSLLEARMLEYVRFRLEHNGEPLPLMLPESALAY